MLVWARGVVFSKINDLPCTISAWWGLRWGALLRGEKKSRLYRGYFIETVFWKRWAYVIACKMMTIEKDPTVYRLPTSAKEEKKIFVFENALTSNDVFGDLREHHEIIFAELNNLLTQKMKNTLASYSVPVIGVHIRRGDFKLGNQTTPLQYFIEGIKVIRATLGQSLPVTIFTDAEEIELENLLALPFVSIAADKADILDILLLSKSKIMILSKSSTFSYWSAFLSEAFVIRPIDDWQKIIKYDDAEGNYREVRWHFDDAASTQQLIKSISNVQL